MWPKNFKNEVKLISKTKSIIFLPEKVLPTTCKVLPAINPGSHLWVPSMLTLFSAYNIWQTLMILYLLISPESILAFLTPRAAVIVQNSRLSRRDYFHFILASHSLLFCSFHHKILILFCLRLKDKDIQRTEICAFRSPEERANVMFLLLKVIKSEG